MVTADRDGPGSKQVTVGDGRRRCARSSGRVGSLSSPVEAARRSRFPPYREFSDVLLLSKGAPYHSCMLWICCRSFFGGWGKLCMNPGPYRGNASPEEAWETLRNEAQAALVDVRSTAEWTYVGIPDLSGAQGRLLRIEWQSFPSMQLNP